MEPNTKEAEMSASKTSTVLDIPDAWLMGFCQALPGRPARTVREAVAYWLEQDRLEADFQAAGK